MESEQKSTLLEKDLHTTELICNLISFSQARYNGFKVSADNGHSNHITGVLKLQYKTSIEIKVVRIETDDRFYEAVVANCNYDAHVTAEVQLVS